MRARAAPRLAGALAIVGTAASILLAVLLPVRPEPLPLPSLLAAGLAACVLVGVALGSLGPRVPVTILAAAALDGTAVFFTCLAASAIGIAAGLPLASGPAGLVTPALPSLLVAAGAVSFSVSSAAPDTRKRAPLQWLAISAVAVALGLTVWPGALVGAIGFAGAAAVEWRSRHEPLASGRWDASALLPPILPAVVAIVLAPCLLAANLGSLSLTRVFVNAAAAVVVLMLAARVTLVLQAHRSLTIAAERAVAQFAALYDVGLATASRTELDEMVRLVADHATDLTECDGAMLALEEPGRGFIVRAQRKFSDQLRDSVGEPLVGIALEALETKDLVVAERYAEHRYANLKLADLIASAMAVPLVAQGSVIGTLTVYSRTPRRFGEATRRLLRLYAAQTAAAIANARLLEESRRLASDDPLTGLLNRRMLVERLEAEVAGATRHGDAFCVVLCDIDGLKQVNDSAGHLMGDEVLRRAARELRSAARTEDVVARFGGDEFVMLLPRTTALQGQALVARAGARLRDATYVWGGRDLPLPRMSFGLAAFPDDGLTADTLIAAADERMYADKSRARASAARGTTAG